MTSTPLGDRNALAEHCNERAADGWYLHTIIQMGSNLDLIWQREREDF